MIDVEKLREACLKYRRHIEKHGPYALDIDALLLIMSAAESILPKTKMIEVWHVEYAELEFGHWVSKIRIVDSKSGAETFGTLLKNPAIFACIRVTGPHKHEIPA